MPLRQEIKKVLVIGSGPIQIGQGAEFDYAGTQACLALKEEGIQVVLVNNNPATIMTDETIADDVYLEPLTLISIEQMIKKERPQGLIGTLGGQTGLNLTVELAEKGILEKYGVELLGTSLESIKKGEDRDLFRQLMLEIQEPIPESAIIVSVEEGLAFAGKIGYPVVVRPAYTLGGAGGGIARDEEELKHKLYQGLHESPIHQVLIEKSIYGWKEIEFEVMRDQNDTCVIICNMENLDPVGVHTGDSIVVAPTQTLTDRQVQMLRDSSRKIIRALGVIGGCNIQFALDPYSDQYNVIEVNPRVSRSSALASKATGYPIARMAAKCAVGYHLDELLNPVTGYTYAAYEPAIDYLVLKMPRFPFDKFGEAETNLGTQMMATGEAMAIDRSFEGALNKCLRSLELHVYGLRHIKITQASDEELQKHLRDATADRIFAIAECMRRGVSIEEIAQKTLIDYWFLVKIERMVKLEQELTSFTWEELPHSLLKKAKEMQFSDEYLAQLFQIQSIEVRERRKSTALSPQYKLVDTCAAEFDALSPYYYSTWLGKDEVEVSEKRKILVIGSGPIRIGQGIEFDYCSVHTVQAIKKLGYEAIVINNNPETVSTDFSVADKLYFEPLTVEDLLAIIDKEKVEGVLVQFGGQTAINLAEALQKEGIRVLGTDISSIHALEDREQFYALLGDLDIPYLQGTTAQNTDQIIQAAEGTVGFPVIMRPSYVIGGQSMTIYHTKEELMKYGLDWLKYAPQRIWPVMIDPYLDGLECECDVVSDGQTVVIPGIFEHIERAGVHSGDSLCVLPPITLSRELQVRLVEYAERIASKLNIVGIMNIQFVIKNDECYVLEVNPRASRTVPILSKITRAPIIDWATKVQLGEALDQVTNRQGLMEEPAFYSVKAPIFSTHKLRGVDPSLGPEMKSTGETLGLGFTFEDALQKAVGQKWVPGTGDVHGEKHRKDWVICSIADREKESCLDAIRNAVTMGYQVYATQQTAIYFHKKGIQVKSVSKDPSEVEELFKTQRVKWVVNIPTKGKDKDRFGYKLRTLSLKYQTPCFTCLDSFSSILKAGDKGERSADILAIRHYHESTMLKGSV